MTSFLASLNSSRALVRDFIVRDLRARYVGSSMGLFWSVIFPLINLFVFMFVFRIILATRWGDEQGALEVSLVMLAGIIVWTGFGESISRSTGAIVSNANLIQKVVFPASVLPTYITVSAFANMCLGLPIILIGTLWFGHISEPDAGVEVRGGLAANGVYEGFDLSPKDGVHEWPHAYIALERAWKEPRAFMLEYSGTATRGVDYIAEHDDVIVPAGSARLFLPIIPLRDRVIEGDETVIVKIVDSGGMDLFADTATFTIHDSEMSEADVTKTLAHRTDSYVSPDSLDHHPLSLGWSLLALPLLLVILTFATIGISAFFAAFNLYWRDTTHLIGVGLTVWMFGTPIFYPAHMIPAEYSFMLMLNPMHWFIEMFRDVTLFARWPDPKLLAMFSTFAFTIFWLGTRFFSKHEAEFADLI